MRQQAENGERCSHIEPDDPDVRGVSAGEDPVEEGGEEEAERGVVDASPCLLADVLLNVETAYHDDEAVERDNSQGYRQGFPGRTAGDEDFPPGEGKKLMNRETHHVNDGRNKCTDPQGFMKPGEGFRLGQGAEELRANKQPPDHRGAE